MSEKILVAIDGSDHAWKALDLASELAKTKQADLIVLHAIATEPAPAAIQEFARIEHARVEEIRARYNYERTLGDSLTREAQKRVRAKGLREPVAVTAEGNVAQSIIEAARDRAVDMIVVGSRGLGNMQGLLMGSVSHKVAHLADCTCVIVK